VPLSGFVPRSVSLPATDSMIGTENETGNGYGYETETAAGLREVERRGGDCNIFSRWRCSFTPSIY
jgi:hypothetical protein